MARAYLYTNWEALSFNGVRIVEKAGLPSSVSALPSHLPRGGRQEALPRRVKKKGYIRMKG